MNHRFPSRRVLGSFVMISTVLHQRHDSSIHKRGCSTTNELRKPPIISLIIKFTISSLAIGLKMSYFPLIRLPRIAKLLSDSLLLDSLLLDSLLSDSLISQSHSKM